MSLKYTLGLTSFLEHVLSVRFEGRDAKDVDIQSKKGLRDSSSSLHNGIIIAIVKSAGASGGDFFSNLYKFDAFGPN